MTHFRTRACSVGLTALAMATLACGRAPEPASSPATTPVYNEQTGRLEQILSDRDGDGRQETRAFMDGARLVRIEMDRDGDGRVDRWEYYQSVGDPPQAAIERAEEAGGPDATVTRREFYVDGLLDRVEEDTTLDGRLDKWETYQKGRLVHVDLDLAGKGQPTRRLVYGADGNVVRMESDRDGDGLFEPDAPAGAAR